MSKELPTINTNLRRNLQVKEKKATITFNQKSQGEISFKELLQLF